MTSLRWFALVLSMVTASSTAPLAQAGGDSASRAVAASERARSGRTIDKRTMAVLPFDMRSSDSSLAALGYGFADFLADDLAHSHRLTIVERLRIADLERERNLSLTAGIDPSTSVRVGRLIAAQHMIFGTIEASANGALTIDERVVNVETGLIDMHHTASTPIDAIFRAERDFVMETFAAFGITLTANEKRELYERVAPLFRAFVAFSTGVRAEQQGNDDLAVGSFQEATALDRNFKLAATRLSAARLRVMARAGSAAAGPDVPSKDAAKDLVRDQMKERAPDPGAARDAKANPSSPISGSAPSGTAAAAATNATPPSTKPEANKKTTKANPKRTHPRATSPVV